MSTTHDFFRKEGKAGSSYDSTHESPPAIFMKNFKGKLMVSALAGLFAVGAGLFAPAAYAAEADTNDGNANICAERPDFHHRKDDMNKPFHHDKKLSNLEIAEMMADDYGVKRAEVIDALNAKVDQRDLHHACLLSKISGQSLESIMIAHHNMNWPELEESLGISREDIQDARNEITAGYIAEFYNVDKQSILKAMKKGFNQRDIDFAILLAQKSNKSLDNIIAKKKDNNKWSDVAKDLNVDMRDLFPEDKRPPFMGKPFPKN